MEIKIVNKSNHRFFDTLASKIKECLNTHPFISDTMVLPKSIKIEVSIEDFNKTSMDQSDYLKTGLIKIIFGNDLYLEDNSPLPSFSMISFDTAPINPNIDKIIYHELGHFIDARLNPSFGYDDALRPQEKRIKSIHFNLWDSYIDGRLGTFTPYLLEERKREAKEVNGIDDNYITRAWNGEFTTYESIVTTAQDILKPHT